MAKLGQKIQALYEAVAKEPDGILNEKFTCSCGDSLSVPKHEHLRADDVHLLGGWLLDHEPCLLPKHKAQDEEVEGERHKPPSIEDDPEGRDD